MTAVLGNQIKIKGGIRAGPERPEGAEAVWLDEGAQAAQLMLAPARAVHAQVAP